MVIDDANPIQNKEKKVRNIEQEELQALNERTGVLQDFFTKRGVMRQSAIEERKRERNQEQDDHRKVDQDRKHKDQLIITYGQALRFQFFNNQKKNILI